MAARYLSDSMLWQVGLLLLLSAKTSTSSPRKLQSYARNTLLVVFAATIISCQVLATSQQWKKAPHFKRAFERQAAVIRNAGSMNTETFEQRLRATKRLHKHYIRHAIDVLQKYQINVFRNPSQPSRTPPNFQKASACQSSTLQAPTTWTAARSTHVSHKIEIFK